MKTPYPLLFGLLFLVMSCTSHPAEQEKETSVIPDSVIRNVQTAPVTLDEDGGFIKLNGKIVPNEAKQAKIFALASGKIQSLTVELGDFVRKGQVLAVLKSSEVAGMSNEVALAESDVAVAEKAMKTTKELYDGGLATGQEYVQAEMAYKKAVSERNRAKQVAAITGADNASYVLTAPINGYLIEKNVSNNSEVRQDNGTNLFTIADISNVWIMANVYEADMNRIHLGDSVTVNTLANPQKNYLGKIDKIYNMLDPDNRTMPVRISMDNPNHELKPEMFVTVLVTQAPTGRELTIPSQALVMENSKNYVIVRENNQLKIREVKLINRVGNKAYINGLRLGEEVVLNEQVFLYQALSAK